VVELSHSLLVLIKSSPQPDRCIGRKRSSMKECLGCQTLWLTKERSILKFYNPTDFYNHSFHAWFIVSSYNILLSFKNYIVEPELAAKIMSIILAASLLCLIIVCSIKLCGQIYILSIVLHYTPVIFLIATMTLLLPCF